jgi:hypothetical protein
MIIRCYNCGLQGHKTQHCPSYGPRYPAPGKTGQDYGDEANRIMKLFAADILAEHSEVDEDEELDPSRRGALKLGSREAAARKFKCDTCGAEVGARCHTTGGRPTACHKARYRLIEMEVPSDGSEPREGHLAGSTAGTD